MNYNTIYRKNGDEAQIKSFVQPVSRMLLLEKELEEIKKKSEALEQELSKKEHMLQEKSRTFIESEKRLKDLELKIQSQKETTERYSDFTEAETRNYLIDTQLQNLGWDIKFIEDKTKDIKEFNTQQVKREVPVTGLINTPSGNGFVDYVLYNEANEPIAIIEAKKTRRNVEEGQEQALQYANALEKMTGFRPLIFYTNGFEILFWDDINYSKRKIYGFFSKEDIESRLFQRANRKDLSETLIDKNIISRDYQFMALRQTYEAFEAGQRKSLIVMASS